MMTWANRITIGRILVIPLFIGCLLYYSESIQQGHPREEWRYAAFVLFLMAAISDAVDGFLARHCNQSTKLGAMLDPIADKFLLFAALITLSLARFGSAPPFPIWFPILIVSRDVLQLTGFFLLRFYHIAVEVVPHWTGKAATFFNFFAVSSALLLLPLTFYFCLLGGFFSVIAGFIYLWQGTRFLGRKDVSTKDSIRLSL
jgi:CDP-diacylglycerol--glycerol-3-phosphate 3-phosphatidyltransferase/cardiolipin synthase